MHVIGLFSFEIHLLIDILQVNQNRYFAKLAFNRVITRPSFYANKNINRES